MCFAPPPIFHTSVFQVITTTHDRTADIRAEIAILLNFPTFSPPQLSANTATRPPMQLYIDKTITFRINIFRLPQTTFTPTEAGFRRGESQFKR